MALRGLGWGELTTQTTRSALVASVALSCLTFNATAQSSDTIKTISSVATDDVKSAAFTSSAQPGQVYEPSFFDRFGPQNALDMVRQVPGFSMDGGDDRRGFGRGGANVLIDGRRVSGKSNSVRDALEKISPEAVVRIEVLDGASLDIPGLSGQVVNVVKKPGEFSGSWRWNPQFRGDRTPIYMRGRVSASGEAGPISYTLGARVNGGKGGGFGIEYLTDADDNVLDRREERFNGGGQFPEISGSMTYLGMSGDILNLNFTGGAPDRGNRVMSFRQGPNIADRIRFDYFSFQANNMELSGDYELDFGPGRLKIIGLAQEQTSEVKSINSVSSLDPTLIEGNMFASDRTSGERIARAEYSLQGFGGDWQFAGEGAFNYYEEDSRLASQEPDETFGTGTPFASTRVEEQRAEVSVTYGRELNPGLDLQATLAGEYSELTQSGDTQRSRDFARPKGDVSLAWKAAPNTDFNLRLAREVGQLDFGDFVSSVDLDNDVGQAGNADLVPEQATVLELETNQRFGDWGALTLTLYGRQVEDYVDYIPVLDIDGITVIDETPGNIDEAEQFGAAVEWTLNLDPIGFEGARTDLELAFNESRLTDPLTGLDRRGSNQQIMQFELEFRHDIPNTDWAWGTFYEMRLRERTYRLNQISQFVATPGFMGAWLQHKDVLGMDARLTVGNLLDANEDNERIIYSDRRAGMIDSIERRSLKFANIFNFSLSGKF